MDTSYVQGQSVEYGEFKPALLTGNGPTSYSQTTGDILNNPASSDYINFPMDCTTQSGSYHLSAQPTSAGQIRAGAPSPSQSGWAWHWFYSSAGNPQGVDSIAIATAGSGQTNGVSTVAASGGGGTGAIVQITIAGGAITSAKVLNPGTGYTSVPTFTVAQGGTPGTLTATIGNVGGAEVATGTNLSAEIVQFGSIVSQL